MRFEEAGTRNIGWYKFIGMMKYVLIIFLVATIISCQSRQEQGPKPEVISLLGNPLYAEAVNDSLILEMDKMIADDPTDINPYLEKGAILESKRQYSDALLVYKYALKVFPDQPELLKRRGQRYITIRNNELALKNLDKAIASHDFQVDSSLTYTENLNWSIWYYKGLAHYLKGDFQDALDGFEESYKFQSDMVSEMASLNWIYNSLIRMDSMEVAKARIAAVEEDTFSGNYYQSILFNKGSKTDLEVLDWTSADDFAKCTIGYSIANRYLSEGKKAEAMELFQKIIATEAWQANGFIAAETDLSRLIEPRLKK